MSKNERLFQITDAELIQAAEVMLLALPDDLAAFTAFDSTITAGYTDQIAQALAAVRAIRPDLVIVEEQAQLTQDLQQAHDQCYADFQTIAHFVRRAFEGNPAMQKKFGLNEVQNIIHNQTKFVRFMELFQVTAMEHKTQLTLAGCNEEVIVNLAAKVKTFRDADTHQEKAKRDRLLVTQQRIEALNTLYRKLTPVDGASQIIFRNNDALKSKYMLPRPPQSSSSVIEGDPPPDVPEV